MQLVGPKFVQVNERSESCFTKKEEKTEERKERKKEERKRKERKKKLYSRIRIFVIQKLGKRLDSTDR